MNIRNYMKKSFVTYMIMFIILLVQVTINVIFLILNTISDGENKFSMYGNDFTTSVLFVLIIVFISLAVSQGIVLMSSIFSFDHSLGKSNKKNTIDIFKFVIFKSFLMSFLLNALILLFQHLSPIRLPFTFGFDWYRMIDLPNKFIIVFIIILTFYSLAIWITSGFKRFGVFAGLSRVAIAVTYGIKHIMYLLSYFEWGVHALSNMLIFASVIILTLSHTYVNMLNYERRT